MSLVAVASAKGAPGVTTFSVALAALFGSAPGGLGAGGEPLLADLDPHGGDVALRYRTDDGKPLDPGVGLLSLTAAIRGGGMPQQPAALVERHSQRVAGGLPVLVGVSGPEQAAGVEALWPQLAATLSGTGRPVVADVGRLGPTRSLTPLLRAADAVLLLARAELEGLAHLRERVRRLIGGETDSGELGPGAARRVGVVLVSNERAVAARTEQLLRSGGLPVRVLGTVADDARGAALLGGGGRAGRTTLVRSVRTLLPAVHELVGATATTELTAGVPGPLAPQPYSMQPPAAHQPAGQQPAGQQPHPQRGPETAEIPVVRP
ncbi:hypothetical protein ACIB24_07575 [Spongisporangium articulatum]|uniref:MinD-like ATPase involved in chromosome partitioning or flagellar assembly n=1 Tax=Spongisporangium articulatum TaxID=3362603 RepID=A0ABW8AKL7_9ACTN